MSARSIIVTIAMAMLLFACKRRALSDGEACDRIAALPGSTWTAADTDRCYDTYSTVGHNVRACTDNCIRRSKTASEFDDCHDDCTGDVYPSFMVCQKITANGRRLDACRERHESLISESKDLYKCWSRCGRRAMNAVEAEACDQVCGVPD